MLLIGLAMPILPAHAAPAISAADRAFAAMVSQGGMFEVKAGTLAAEKGSTQDIKDQGASEAHDHALVGAKLTDIAASDGIATAATLNARFQGQLDSLAALSGEAFDAAYLRQMEAVHDADGAAFAKEAKGGTDPKLVAFAAETHRIVVRHIGALRARP